MNDTGTSDASGYESENEAVWSVFTPKTANNILKVSTSGLVGKWLYDHYLKLMNNCVR